MAKQKDFDSFLSNIEPSKSTVDYISSVQTNLRSYLDSHSEYKSIVNDTFLSGSYAKHTSIRPATNDKKRDVDIIVVTNYSKSKNSDDVLQELCDVLKEKSLYQSAVVQLHSVSLELSNISVDVVPVIIHESKDNMYYIGSSKDGSWKETDPKGHKSWSTEVNVNNNVKYKPLVKIFKWWRRINCPSDKKYPKGITLEKIIADNLGDSSLSTEDFLIATMQNIVDTYSEKITSKTLPYIDDPSKNIENNDLLDGYEFDDFNAFYNKIVEHLKKLNDDGTENSVWRDILGNEFPCSKENSETYASNYSYLNVSHREKPQWPMRRSGAVFITAKVIDENRNISNYENDSYPISKNCDIIYNASYNSCKYYRIFWQVVNTGYEARNCLRGGFEESNYGKNGRKESTAYSGKHYVQCFVIDSWGNCIAKSKEFFINIK